MRTQLSDSQIKSRHYGEFIKGIPDYGCPSQFMSRA